MITKLFKITAVGILLLSLCSFYKADTFSATTVKCMLQTKQYDGEGAYIVVSLLNDKGAYEKTLYMFGKEAKWYDTLIDWYRYIGRHEKDVDAISGATITPGARSVISFDFPQDKLDKGYTLRFESAVEDLEYYYNDLEIPLTSENLKGKFEGTGYIRYVRLIGK